MFNRRQQNTNTCYLGFAIMAIVLNSCNSREITQRKLIRLNPVTWTFNSSRNTVETCLRDHRFNIFASPGLPGKQINGSLSFSKEKMPVTATQETEVIYLNAWHSPFWQSPVYYVNNEGAPYFSDFIIRLEEVPGNKTIVSVDCVTPTIISGTEFTIGHAWRKNIYEPVSCSSIEEYTILLAIGKCTKSSGMPAIQMP